MKTIRFNTFETNSSSTHAFTLSKTKRNKKEFPLPDENGVLSIELKNWFDCGSDCTCEDSLNELPTLLEYYAAHAVFSYDNYTWRHEGEDINAIETKSMQKNLKQYEDILKEVYKELKLPEVKKLEIYAVTKTGEKIVADAPNVLPCTSGYWFESDEDRKNYKFKHYFGLPSNDLRSSSFYSGACPDSYDSKGLGVDEFDDFSTYGSAEFISELYTKDLIKYSIIYHSNLRFYHT